MQSSSSRARTLLALALISVLAVVAISVSVLHWRRSRAWVQWKVTVVGMDNLIRAMNDYSSERGRYPHATTFEGLRRELIPKYASESDIPLRDKWDRPFHCVIAPENYVVWSPGADDRRDSPPIAPEIWNADIVVYNGTFMRLPLGPAIAWAGPSDVTALDEKSDRSNTGVIDFTGWRYGRLELRRGNEVVRKDGSQFEVPPGDYRVRAVLSSGQTFDVPETFTVKRNRFIQRAIAIPAGTVEFEIHSSARSADALPYEIWSGGQRIATLGAVPDEKSTTHWASLELFPGTYSVRVKGVDEKAFVVRAGQDSSVSITVP